MTETPLIAAGVVNGDRKLADLLAVAIVEHGVCSGTKLAVLVGVRKQHVLRELRDARRFERVGRGANSAWRLTGTDQEPMCGVASPALDSDITADLRDLLTAILMRLDGVERMLAPEPSAIENVAAPLAGQLDVYEALAAVNANGQVRPA